MNSALSFLSCSSPLRFQLVSFSSGRARAGCRTAPGAPKDGIPSGFFVSAAFPEVAAKRIGKVQETYLTQVLLDVDMHQQCLAGAGGISEGQFAQVAEGVDRQLLRFRKRDVEVPEMVVDVSQELCPDHGKSGREIFR